MTRDSILMPFDGFFDNSFFTKGIRDPFNRQLSLMDRPFGGIPKGFFDTTSLDVFKPSSSSSRNVPTLNGQDTSNPDKFVMNVPLGGNIGPEDLKVTLKDHVMTVEAKKEKKSEDGNGSSRAYQEFSSKFTLPPNVRMNEVTSTLTAEGHLKVEAPLHHQPQQQQLQQQQSLMLTEPSKLMKEFPIISSTTSSLLDRHQKAFDFPKSFDNDFDVFGTSLVQNGFHSQQHNNTTNNSNNTDKFSINVPLGKNIGPEDLKVSLKDNVMTIEAKKEQKSEDGTSSSRVYQEFKRMFTLPPNVDAKEVKTVLTPEGHLKIEAPQKPPQPQQQPQILHKPVEIPISKDHSWRPTEAYTPSFTRGILKSNNYNNRETIIPIVKE